MIVCSVIEYSLIGYFFFRRLSIFSNVRSSFFQLVKFILIQTNQFIHFLKIISLVLMQLLMEISRESNPDQRSTK